MKRNKTQSVETKTPTVLSSSPTSTANPMQQHQHRRRSRIRRYLRNLKSFLRPMPRNQRNPPPGDVPLETNLLPLPQPPPTPTMTPKQPTRIPPIQTHPVPNITNPTQHVSYAPYGHGIQPAPAGLFRHDPRSYPDASYSFPVAHPHAMSSTFSHTPDTSFRNLPMQEPPRRLCINQIPRNPPPPPPPPLPLPHMQPSPMTSEHHVSPSAIRITPPATRMQSHPTRMQPYPVRTQSDFPHPGTANPRHFYNPLPRQALDVPNHVRQQMLVEALHRRASGMHRPVPHHPNPNFPAAEIVQSQPDPQPMHIDSMPGVARIPRATRAQRVEQSSSIGVAQPSYPFMNDLSTREHNPQLPIPTSNMSFTLPETTSQHPQSSHFPDPALLTSSLPPHQLARLYGMLQRSTTTTRAPPQSATQKPVQPGKSRRAQKQRAQKVPRSPRARAVRALKGDHIFRMLTLSQAPSHWFGALEVAHIADGRNATVTIPVGAFLYTLTNKPAFTASLPESLKLGTDTARKFDEVVSTAAGGQFLIRVSPVNDYGHTVGNSRYADFVSACMSAGCAHCVQVDAGSLFLFPVSFPQVGVSLVGVFVSN